MADWYNASTAVRSFVFGLVENINQILGDNYLGFYLHGSLAMGGFNPYRSDIDVLVVTRTSITKEAKKELAELFLKHSVNPYPIEVSFLHNSLLDKWEHPSLFDFHYSEYWRERFEKHDDFNQGIHRDPDLAAHIYVLTQRGICIDGESIAAVFPEISSADFLSSIKGDYKECFEEITEDPIYCSLNMLRVLIYIKTGDITSKQEAGEWGLKVLPVEYHKTIKKVLGNYQSEGSPYPLLQEELLALRDYMDEQIMQ